MLSGLMADLIRLPSSLKLFSDPTRLRMMALLERAELAVGELSRALGVAQSRVSNHLRLLREAGLVSERHAGSSTFLRLSTPQNGHALAGRLWEAVRGDLDSLPEHAADLARLEHVLAERRRREGDFFDQVAGEWDEIGVHFESGQARQRVVAHALAGQAVVADLGCGTGYFARALLGLSSRVIAVDRSRGMLDQAEKRLSQAPAGALVELRLGEMDALPIEDGEVDAVVAGMVLHHLPDLRKPVAEMLRVLRPGGNAVVLELEPHRHEWLHSQLGDHHLGLAPQDVVRAFQSNGFEDVVLEPVDDHYRPRRTNVDEAPVDLPLYLVRGTKPRA